MTPRHLRVLTVLLVTGCAAGEVFHTMDACPGATLCDQLDEAFNVSGVYATSEEHRMYCHMESGRWTEILRRGQDAAGTALPVADHQSLAPGQDPDPMVVGFGDAVDGEFYIGNQELANKLSLLPPWSVQLKVSLLGQNGVRYFSVFNNFHAYSDPLRFSITTLQYRMGTAGDGQLAALDNAIYNGACTPTAWFGTGASCDAAVDQGPALTLPLTDTDQRNGRTPWPTLPVQLKAISLQIRNGQAADACPGLEQNFNFDGDVLDNIENTVPESVGPGDSFTITCKNSSWILPTQANAAEAIPNSVTFTCVNTTADPAPVDHRMDNWPLVTGKPCMAPCPANYTLYVPGTNTKAMESTPDRVTCLSPPSTEPAKSAMDAAARCGEKGEQLLDFVPKPSFLPGLDTSQPHWLWMQQLNGYNQQLNSREEVSGSYNDGTFQCVQVNYSGTQPFLVTAQCHSDWRGTNPYRNFVCMTAVGCGPDAVFHAGSCYKYLQSVLPNDHVRQCLNSGGTPADYTASFVAEALPQLGVPTGSPATPLVGIYRRYGKFWRPDGSLVPEDEFDGATYGDQTLQCAAPLPTDPTKLTAIDCAADTVNHGVICQMAAHVSAALDPCSVRYDQLLNASSTGPMPQLVQTSNLMPTATLGDEVTFTCPDGFNMHNLTDFHSVLLICQGFVSGWLYPAQMDVALHGQPLQCIFACDVSESVTPLNSELVTEGPDQVFRCLAPMQTAAGSTDQLVVCDHQTGQLDASSLKPCDHCLMHPLIPDELSGFTSSWDNVTRLEGTTVTYTCLSGLQTPAGDTLQNQTCTANGWEGEVVPCSQCAPLDEDVQLRAALASLEGPQLFGALANVSCPSNIESGNGSLSTSVICMPSGWSWCIGDFNCSYCSGSPPNVSAMATITSDWDGEQRTFNTTVLYSCSAGLETVDGATEQTANCTETGWQDGVLPCDVCSNPPNGSHPTISATQPTGNGTLGSSLKFVCNSGLSQIDGATSILSVCTETGWTNCSEDIKCEYCTPLPNLPDGTMDWGSYAGERTLGTEVTLTCGDGLAIPGSLKKTQTVVCDMDGWNHTDVKSCTVCDKEPPAPASDMTLAWTLGDSQAVYQCPNDTMLPWGLTSYRMLCSPDGWSDCVPECSACVFAPPAGPGVVMTSQNVSRGGTANYECRANMTSAGATELELSCTETGWTDAEMITCDRCASEPAEAGPAQNRTGNVTSLIGNTLQYQCAESMITAAGLTEQSVNCSDNGWSEPPAPCDHCILPAAPNSTAQTWDLSENVTEGRVPVGTNITFFCSNVTSTLVSNSSNLTLSCGADGWSGEPEPCVSCLGAIPDPGNGTDARNVTWDGGRQDGALVLYTCQNGAQHEVVCTDREWLPAQLGSCGKTLVRLPPPSSPLRRIPPPPLPDRAPSRRPCVYRGGCNLTPSGIREQLNV